MRVVHIVTAFPRHDEDPITPWLVELIRRQRADGLDASVLAPAYRGGPAAKSGDIPVHRFRYAPRRLETLTHDETVPDRLRRSPAHGLLLPSYLGAGTRAAYRLGRARRPTIAHVHWPMPHALFGAAMRAGSDGRTRVVNSYYSVEIHWVRARLRALVPFLRWTAETADALTAISTPTARAVRELVDRPVAVIPYGATLVDDGRPPDRRALSGSSDAPVRVLFVGRLVERKGVEVLVEALAEGGFGRPVELRIVGAGEWEPNIREAIRTAKTRGGPDISFELLGRISGERLEAEYQSADVFVLPAVRDAKGDTEGLGVVLLEALRFERPVIGSDIGGIPDIVRDGDTGLLVRPRDPSALAAALRRLLADPEEARAMAVRGRARASDAFGWDGIVAATRRVYEQAAGE